MWEKFIRVLLAQVIPVSTLTSPVAQTVPNVDIQVEPLAKIVQEQVEPPAIASRAGLVIETHSNETLFEKNVWDVFPIASLTKLMTALVVREHLELDTIVEVNPLAANIEGSRLGLIAYERMTVKDLLRGLLIPSGNDAAFALSMAVAGNQEQFVTLMNQRTKALGLENTRFVDPAGLGDGNVSSAFELAHLAKQVFKDPFLAEIMKEESAVLNAVDQEYVHQIKNTNRLLGTDLGKRIIAGKTGTTKSAGQCLIAYLRTDSDRTILSIVLGSPDRYSDMGTIIDWVDANYHWN
ncbi:MAG: serine hydrolase [Candidatus Gracilibacteria bacterium]|nr:serine hydrolase [Candidatus Gracilibacteria bacterium]